VARRQLTYEAPIHFLRPGRFYISGPETGFDVPHVHFAIKGCKRGGKCSSRIALDQDPIRGELIYNSADPLDSFRCNLFQRLTRGHKIEIKFRAEIEGSQYLVKHLSVLSCDAGCMSHTASLSESLDNRGKLDRLGACSKDRQNPHSDGLSR
jgi:hypothetical protein